MKKGSLANGPLQKLFLSTEPFDSGTAPYRSLKRTFEKFAGKSIIFAETGGVPSAAISDGHSIKFFSEDIGRHNAVDKVIGKAFLEKIDFSAHFLLLSGRISSEMVKKSFYAGLSAIVSRAAAGGIFARSALMTPLILYFAAAPPQLIFNCF